MILSIRVGELGGVQIVKDLHDGLCELCPWSLWRFVRTIACMHRNLDMILWLCPICHVEHSKILSSSVGAWDPSMQGKFSCSRKHRILNLIEFADGLG
jgi:hypothetical protein